MKDTLRLSDDWEWKSETHRRRFLWAMYVVAGAGIGAIVCVLLSNLPPATFDAIAPALARGAPWLALIALGALIVRYRGLLRLPPVKAMGAQSKYRVYAKTADRYKGYRKVEP